MQHDKTISRNILRGLVAYGVSWLLVVLSSFFLLQNSLAQSVQLNSFIEVETDYVTLGDIFTPLQTSADHVILAAPKPGKSLTLDAKTLRRIARSFKLDWLPTDSSEARVLRLGTEVARAEVEQALRDAIVDLEQIQSRVGHKWIVKIDKAPQRYFTPAQNLPEISIENLRFDRVSSRFQADVSLYKSGSNVRIRGEFFAVVSVPVPLNSIAANENITARDLHFIDMRKNTISPNVQTDVEKILGKSSKRLLRVDTPITIQYLQEPLLVKRNALVSVVYEVKNLTLITKGMALADGSMGQVVRIKNLKSNRIIDSVVTGSDEVSVSFAGDFGNS